MHTHGQLQSIVRSERRCKNAQWYRWKAAVQKQWNVGLGRLFRNEGLLCKFVGDCGGGASGWTGWADADWLSCDVKAATWLDRMKFGLPWPDYSLWENEEFGHAAPGVCLDKRWNWVRGSLWVQFCVCWVHFWLENTVEVDSEPKSRTHNLEKGSIK